MPRLLRCVSALVVMMAGCGQEDPAGDPFVVRDSAGVRLVEIRRGVTDTLRLTLDPSWPAGEPAALGDLLDVDVRPDGSVLLLDGYSAEVLVLDGSGHELLRFGRPGSGPGEFNPRGLSAVLSTDTSIVVPDLVQQRVTEFSWDGEPLRTRRLPGAGGYAVDWKRHPDGGLAFRLLQQGGDALVRWRDDAVDTLFVFQGTGDEPNQLLSSVAVWDIRDDALALATAGDWAVRLRPLHAHGLRWMARRAGAPEPVSEDDRNALEDLLIRSAAIGAGGVVPTGEARARLLAQVSFPSVKPALSRLLIGADGAVWIREVAPIADMGREALRVGSAAGYGGPWWTVLAPDGSVRSHVRLPDGFQVTRLVDGWLYGIQADALGVERPARVASPW